MSESDTVAKWSVAAGLHSFDRPAAGPHGTGGDRLERQQARGSNGVQPVGPPPANKKITAEQILAKFNVRAFRREPPANLQLMLQFISRVIAVNEAIPFIMYWGKGPRAEIAGPDRDCVAFLGSMIERICEVYAPGARLKLIFTDTHALLNGHDPAGIRAYFEAIELCAQARGFDTAWLGDIVRAAPVSPAVRVPAASDAAGAERVAMSEEMAMSEEVAMSEDMTMSEDMVMRLTASARKWYRGEGTAEEGARRYYQANMVERRAVERAYPHAIMITFNSSALRALLPPRLPVFYMYSIRRGLSVKPWFIVPEAER